MRKCYERKSDAFSKELQKSVHPFKELFGTGKYLGQWGCYKKDCRDQLPKSCCHKSVIADYVCDKYCATDGT